jgi:hypothetical protein
VLLEVLLAGADELKGDKLEAAVLEARDDGANESTLHRSSEYRSKYPIEYAKNIPGHHRA